ncbi:protein MFI isoform X2 [Denticeps clupeoides]|uniref:protein MFI isoform X2 n=1 Tax=Denticeps clupeoides TaxID=299321 RepID=UPI0010A507F1|nr:uncharacterized protein C11orf65-like isoform X2 [Denticeps clupeoides]
MYACKTEQTEHMEHHHRAARIIQRCWRRYVHTQVFKYFKSLVTFHKMGDPRLLLKNINPRETEIMDAASGIYVRFRLGGVSFPPNIYYKIFTHRPVVDLGASSPRDYAHEATKLPVPGQVHGHCPVAWDDRSGWYQRVENNGWRLLAGRMSLLGDPIIQETNGKRFEFNYATVQRRQDVERKKKQRKLAWLKKMYEEGILHSARPREKSAHGMMNTVEQEGPNHNAEWEEEELLKWTTALDFDEYVNRWKDLGTSHSSDFFTDKVLDLSKHSPCESSQPSHVQDIQSVT